MTTGGDFSYSDDSVVAKVSVDINANSLTSISQLTQAMSALRTEQEANARATSDWVTYLNEIPAISERANQAYRESITLMERMSYIQSEINGGPTSNVGPTANAGPGGRPTYSTAAAPGYVNPWVAGTAGMGQGEGMGGTYGFLQAMAGQDPRMYANMMAARGIPINPAMMGMVGGAAVGDVGAGGVGGTGGGQGWGAASPGSQSPQPTQHDRDSAAPPDPTGPWSTHTPDKPHIDAPGWQDEVDALGPVAKQVMDESRVSSGMPADAFSRHMAEFWDRTNTPSEEAHGESRSPGRGGAKKVRHEKAPSPQGNDEESSEPSDDGDDGLSNLASKVANELRVGNRYGGISGMGLKGLSGAARALGSNAVGSVAGKMGISADALGGAVKGLGSVGVAAGGALAINEAIQKIGELDTKYSQLGSVQGGGAVEGFGYEMQARIMGLNPFITTEQARTVMQMTLREGFRGGNFDTVQQFMMKNFKEMGMSFSDSMELTKNTINATGNSVHTFAENMNDVQKTLDTMKILTKEGGASLPTREEQLKNSMDTLTALAVPPEAAHKMSMQMQQAFKDIPLLREKIPDQITNAIQNPMFLTQMAANQGMTGLMPEEILPAMADAGVDLGNAAMDELYRLANLAKGMSNGNVGRGAYNFQKLMAGEGVTMDPNTAKALYKELIGGRDVKGDMNKDLADAANKTLTQKKPVTQTVVESMLTQATDTVKDPLQRGNNIIQHAMKDEYSDVASELPGFFGSMIPGSGYVKNLWNGMFGDSTKNQAAQDPAVKGRDSGGGGGDNGSNNGGGGPSAPIKTEGNVTGNLTVTVLQNGQVQAPPTIQLTGQQKSAAAGYGGAQVNNAPPGDPTYNHAYTGWSR